MPLSSQHGFDTLCIHGGHQAPSQRAHLTPLFATSTYTFDSAEQAETVFQGQEPGYIYGRFGSPTIREAEEKIALLEGFGLNLKLDALLHASGMAAISTLLLANLKAGDKIITHRSLYGGTQEMLDKVLPGLGIEAIVTDFGNIQAVERLIKNEASIRMMYLETPANPTLQCVSLEAYCALGKQQGLLICADNTFATPYLQQPFRFGLDFVVHSTTKFLNGHGTAVGGVLVFREDLESERKQKLIKTHRLLGGNSNAFDAFLLTNGLRTLGLRMERHCTNAQAVAEFLEQEVNVERVYFPGLTSHPHHELAQQQMKYPAPVLSFELKGGIEAGRRFMNALRLCSNAVSLGTTDTILSHPASTTHVGVPREARLASGISDGLIRMSVGMENIEDLLADLRQALKQATA
ncbi:MAG: aminotransferase class I/II-fold pyridoxal phosphate-dependent enzyme [Bacteroidetes bacterium]|nr:aminotransferase class I/II-fold pyridoxal phosphate-dependent enzyme [Bacteroidota bacterium]